MTEQFLKHGEGGIYPEADHQENLTQQNGSSVCFIIELSKGSDE